MKAVRLHGARDFRYEDVPEPRNPGPGEAVIRVGSVGVCGSDLHTYADGRIGDTVFKDPMVLGHEFAGTVIAVGSEAYDGLHRPLTLGQRVAVDPAMPCWRCDKCEEGNPNLCRNLRFMGMWPDDGALQECLIVPARSCFPMPDDMPMEVGAMMEPLGVALHTTDLAKFRLAQNVVVLGCGPIGLLILRLARLSGVGRLIALDQFPWRLDAARAWGADDVVDITTGDPVSAVRALLGGRGADVVIEAAWGGDGVRQAVDMADLGARLVLVGVPGDDSASFRHSSARRKGLTIKMVRRMKLVMPRALALASAGRVDLPALVTHRFSLAQTDDAYALNLAYQDNIIKAMIEVNGS